MFTRREKTPVIDLALASRLFKDCFTKETAAANYLDLADRCGVDSKTAERWLNGKQQPDRRNLALLAKALGCTVGQLLGNDAHPLREVIGVENLVERREETAAKENEEDSKVLLSLKITETSSKLRVTLEGDKESYSKYFPASVADAFVKCLANIGIAAEKEKIVHLNTEFGSIILTFEMPAEWAKALELAARHGELREFGITDVQVVDDTQKMDVSHQRKEGEHPSYEESRPNPVEGKLRPNADDSLETKSIDEGSEEPPSMSQEYSSTDSAPEGKEINLPKDSTSAIKTKGTVEHLFREDGYYEVRLTFRGSIRYLQYVDDALELIKKIVTQFPVGITRSYFTSRRGFVLAVTLNEANAKKLVSAFNLEKRAYMGIINITFRYLPSFDSSKLKFKDINMLNQWQSQLNRPGKQGIDDA